ncbi:MAG: nitroreductase/quinone reductase family protein [bacterium]|nr:nitroreductase/quinone reductase family protein [bacterium]
MPPRWFVRLAWRIHSGLYRLTRRRKGLRPPRPNQYGLMHLTAIGRRSGRERPVMLAYVEDGPNLVTLAMNGWDPAEPAWWLNLQATPEAHVALVDGERDVVARVATDEERRRLWQRWAEVNKKLDAFAERRPNGTAVVVLEPAKSPT